MDVAQVFSSDFYHLHAVQTVEIHTLVEELTAATNLKTDIL